ncbi:unnamed protein product [Allacma fusca]|uniref:Ig-like domain-containing protein n=1 Tax=Allacma fusca TaxID=39272 RepID=A0A8J2P7K6_9HEXA|nr:unnamed protein product [Allacma fusca]
MALGINGSLQGFLIGSLLLHLHLPLTVVSSSQAPPTPDQNQVYPLEALFPLRTEEPVNITVQAGSPLHLECFTTSELQALPTIRIRWVRGKKKKFFYFVHARTVSRSSEPLLSPIQQSLRVEVTTPSHSGWWACMGNIYDVTPTGTSLTKNPRNHFFIKWFHVRVVRQRNLISKEESDLYGFKNSTAAPFGGLKYLFSIGSLLFNFSIVAFCIAIFGCLCCGGCFCL